MKVCKAVLAALSLGWAATMIISAPLMAQELEPGVQTSSAAAPTQRSVAPAPAPAAKAPPPAKPAASTAKSATTPAPVPGKSSDRIELDTTQISGNRELPKVMYVVPWRRADPGDFSGKPPNSLLDEALTPVDRDVFRRQNRYYGVMQDQAQSAKSQAGAASAASGGSTPKDEK
jgi:hypothetical protein